MSANKPDGTRFVDAEDLAKAERLILEQQDAVRGTQARPHRHHAQFTLASVLFVTFFICLGLSAGGDWIPAPTFAGIMGFLAIVTITSATIAFPKSLLGRVVWIAMTFAYYTACLVVLLRALNW